MNNLKQSYTFTDFLFYACLLAVPLLTAILAIGRSKPGWAILYVLLALAMSLLMLKFYCTRCPHYTREGESLNCIFFWKLPKFFKPRPGPLDLLDKLILFAALAAVVLFPLPWLFKEPGLLIIFLLSVAGFAASVRRNECARCIYFECPVNLVSEQERSQYQDTLGNE
jgi:hypothetical protein